MTYGELKDRVLQLIFSYSLAGTEIPSTYNNQADYINKIPGLLNTAQTYLYQFKRFETAVAMTSLDKQECGSMDMYTIPANCLRMKPGLIKPGRSPSGHLFERYTDYRRFGGDKILIPHGAAEAMHLIFEYERRVTPVTSDVSDDYILENTDEVNEILPFYIAAQLVQYDDSFRYAALKNEFEDRLSRLALNPVYTEECEIRDAYFPDPTYTLPIEGYDPLGLGFITDDQIDEMF